MTIANLSGVEEASGGERKEPVVMPADIRLVKCVKSEVKQNEKGEYWIMTFIVQGGEFDGNPVWDKIFFYGKALSRVRLYLSRLGGLSHEQMDQQADYDPSLLLGKYCKLGTQPDTYYDKETVAHDTNKVTFAGVFKIEPGEGAEKSAEGDVVPF